jgi:hypothetical protein
MRRVAARMLAAFALVFVLGACTTFGSYVALGTNEPGWTKAGKPLGSSLEWSGDGTSLLVAAEIVPCEFPFTVNVTNFSADELGVVVRSAGESTGTDPTMGTSWTQGGQSWPQRFAPGTEIVVRGASGDGSYATVAVALRADRPWTTESPVVKGDTISYDLVLTRRGIETVLPLRFEVVRVGSDFHWWTPLAYVAVGALVWAAPELALRMMINGL